jgi:hypothetical protein
MRNASRTTTATAVSFMANANIGHPKLFMGGEESGAKHFAAATGE